MDGTTIRPPIVVLSNRGPVSFTRNGDGGLVAKRGGGGLVSGLAPLVAGTDATWIAAAMSDADREAATGSVTDTNGLRVRLLDIPADVYRGHYDVVCNETLWFAIHGLFDAARAPRLDDDWWTAWDAYRSVNATFADAAAAAAPDGAVVLVQDYHLALVAPELRSARPDLSCVYFGHTPWCDADGLVPLGAAAEQLVDGIGANDAVGFHTERWAMSFGRSLSRYAPDRAPASFVASLSPDPDELATVAASEECENAKARLAELVGDRKLVARVDRMELSKNILRGFDAFEALLRTRVEWRERVVFVALCYPSRQNVGAYSEYRTDVEAAAAEVNARWATRDWQPVVLESDDDLPRSVAALALADVVIVNPVRDGLNLVAKEQALVSERHAALVLSTEAGAWEELGGHGAIGINPFDIRATAEALHAALAMDEGERRNRHEAMLAATLAQKPADWLSAQLAALSA